MSGIGVICKELVIMCWLVRWNNNLAWFVIILWYHKLQLNDQNTNLVEQWFQSALCIGSIYVIFLLIPNRQTMTISEKSFLFSPWGNLRQQWWLADCTSLTPLNPLFFLVWFLFRRLWRPYLDAEALCHYISLETKSSSTWSKSITIFLDLRLDFTMTSWTLLEISASCFIYFILWISWFEDNRKVTVLESQLMLYTMLELENIKKITTGNVKLKVKADMAETLFGCGS